MKDTIGLIVHQIAWCTSTGAPEVKPAIIGGASLEVHLQRLIFAQFRLHLSFELPSSCNSPRVRKPCAMTQNYIVRFVHLQVEHFFLCLLVHACRCTYMHTNNVRQFHSLYILFHGLCIKGVLTTNSKWFRSKRIRERLQGSFPPWFVLHGST